MKKRKLCGLLAAWMAIVMLLTACTSTVDTTMTLSESFSGQRDILCTLSGSLANSQENALQELIKNHCPAELTPVIGETGGKKTVNFILTFSSEAEYVQKLETLLGRKPTVRLRRTDTIFCQGMTYHEDFSSKDLLVWLDEAAVEAGLIKAGDNIWTLERPRLTLGGKTYTSKGDNLEIADTVAYAVEKITINTLLNKEGRFDRTITIALPKRTVDALGSQLTAYLNGLAPDGVLNDSPSGKEFVVEIAAVTAAELSTRTANLLDNEYSQSGMETDSAATTRFIEQHVFTETLDFSSYGNENGKVYVNYLFSVEIPYDFTGAKIQQDGAWSDAPGFTPEVGYVQQGEIGQMDVQLTVRKQFALTDVLLYTEKTAQDQYRRTVTLQFDPAKGLQGPQAMQSYLHDKGFGDTAVETDKEGNHIVTVTIEGDVQSLSNAMAALFGEENRMTYTTGGGLFAFVRTVDFAETVDMADFLREVGYEGTVKYTLSANFDNVKEAKIQTAAEEPVTETIDGEFNLSFAPEAAVHLTFAGSQANTPLLILMAVLALVFIVTLLILIFKSMRNFGKKEKAVLPSEGDTLALSPQISTVTGGGYPVDREIPTAGISPLYADVDTNAETETILLEERAREGGKEMQSERKKRGKKNQYAVAKQILTETDVFGGGPKGKSTRQHLKEEKKRSTAENQSPSESAVQPAAVPTAEALAAPAAPVPTPAFCQHCGKPLRRDALFCTFCGNAAGETPPARRNCPVCGNLLDGKYAFCNQCGSKID